MRELVQLFVAICLLNKGPQDVPSSPFFLQLLLAGNILSAIFVLILAAGWTLGRSVSFVLVDIVLLCALTYAFLYFRRYSVRFVQTLSALTGTGIVLNILLFPILLIRYSTHPDDGSFVLVALLWLAFLVWSIAIMGHIFHHALSVSRSSGIGYTLIYIFLSWAISDWLLPPAVA